MRGPVGQLYAALLVLDRSLHLRGHFRRDGRHPVILLRVLGRLRHYLFHGLAFAYPVAGHTYITT